MKQKLLKKLSSYGVVAGATVLSTTSLNAAIVYNDIDPDTVMLIAGSNSYEFDIDGDNVNDILINTTSFSGGVSYPGWGYASIFDNNSNMSFVKSYNGGSPYLKAFSSKSIIKSVSTSTSYFSSNAFVLGYGGTGSWSSVGSNGFSANDEKLLGFRIAISGNVKYGWMRLETLSSSVNSFDSIIVKDFAYEDFADSIHAGHAGDLVMVSNIVASDINDNGNASDIKVTFDKLTDETGVEAYHAIVMKASNTAPLSIDTIKNLDSLEIIEIPVTGSNINYTLPSNLLDSDGDAIVDGASYKIIIAAQGVEDVIYWNHSVSDLSNTVILTNTTSIENRIEKIAEISSFNKTVNVKSLSKVDLNIEIFTIDGKSIYNQKMNSREENINLYSFNSGIYIIKIESSKGMITKKIVL